MAHSLADRDTRKSSDFSLGPYFLEVRSGPERVLTSIQMWDFSGDPYATRRSSNELQCTFVLKIMPQNNTTVVSSVFLEATVCVR